MIHLPPLSLPFGKPGSRYTVNTPALILDLDILESNVRAMAGAMRGFGRELRPHAKSHKSSRIAALQMAAGAKGICCATLDEAEALAAAGLSGLLITSPVTAPAKLARLAALMAAVSDTAIVVDDPGNVAAIAGEARRAGASARLFVDVELGFERTGVPNADAAEALAHAIMTTEGAVLAGVQAYGGHLQHIADHATRVRETRSAAARVADVVSRLAAAGFLPPVVSGGGTGTHAIDGADGPFTEIQAGSYVLMDADYNAIAYDEARAWPFGVSLFVQASVISANVPGTVIVDAGTKALALNGKPPKVASPAIGAAAYEFAGDEHGRIRLTEGVVQPAIGSVVELVVSHCDPTVAHYDAYHCVRGDVLVDVWPVDARGRRNGASDV